MPFKPQKVPQRNGISSYFSEHGHTISDSSDSSSHRPHKAPKISRKLSKRNKGRSSSQQHSYDSRPLPGRENERPDTGESGQRRSFGSVDSKFSSKAYKVRGFDMFAPRPTLRCIDGASSPSSGRSKHDGPSLIRTRSSSHKAQSRASPNPDWRYKGGFYSGSDIHLNENRVDGYVDELDTHGIRELMERDQRRRAQRKKEKEEVAQKKLERRAASQRNEEKARNAGYGPSSAEDYDMSDFDFGERSRAAEPVGHATSSPIQIHEDRPQSQHGMQTPLSWFNDNPSVEDISKESHLQQQQQQQQFPLPRPDVATPVSMDSRDYRNKEREYQTNNHLEVQDLRHVQGQTPGAHIAKEVELAMNAITSGTIPDEQKYYDEMRDTIAPTPVLLTSFRNSDSSNSLNSGKPDSHRAVSNPRDTVMNHYYSSGAGSPDTGRRSAMSTSLASIESEEGFWLSGRINPRMSGNPSSPLRTSSSSIQRRRYLDLDDDNESVNHEDHPYYSTKPSSDEAEVGGAHLDLDESSDEEDNDPNALKAAEIWHNDDAKSDIVVVDSPIRAQSRSGMLNTYDSEDSDDEDARTAVKVGGPTDNSSTNASEQPTPSGESMVFETPNEYPYDNENTPRKEFPSYPTRTNTDQSYMFENFETPMETAPTPRPHDYFGTAR